MKKVLTFLLAAVMCLSLGACGAESSGESQTSQTTASKSTASATTDNSKIDVLMVAPNNLGDKSFSDLVWKGIQNAKKTYGLGEVKCTELLGDSTLQVPTLTEAAESGKWDLIVTGTFSMKESIVKVAAEFPKQKFIVYDTELDYTNGAFANCSSYVCMQNEGSFLAGAMATYLTQETGIDTINKEKTIGYIGGVENTSIMDFLVGYIQGMQYVDPESKMLISFVGNFTDTAKAKELALTQKNQGADIIFAVCSGAGLGVYDAAKESNFLAIGVDSDQALILQDTDKATSQHIVTSVVKNFDVVLSNAIGEAISGNFKWGVHHKINLANKGIGIAENSYYQSIVPQKIRDKVTDIAKKIASGEIAVETAYGMDKDTYNKIKASATK